MALQELTGWRRTSTIASLIVLAVLALVVIVDQAILPAVTSASGEVRVPTFTGMSRHRAEALAQSHGLVIHSVREQYSDTAVKGRVLSQLPYPGAIVKEGRHIYLTVSRGIESVFVPSLVGMTQREARLSLMKVGLSLGDVSYEYSDSVAHGRIVAQGIVAGQNVAYGTVVDVVLSQGPQGLPIPLVEGLPASEAKSQLEALGYAISIRYTPSGLYESNTVVRQIPKDTILAPGVVVTLEVAR
ncbi:MAG: PASTA domain-containing protein [Candidatus Kapabacteria bacterium]|jgi:serine/threonine-protein kinase|nr:PASTA domain-containing protein [Candidatus Kapabacteria bacterium]